MSKTVSEVKVEVAKDKLDGLGGWLILVGIGVVLGTVVSILGFLATFAMLIGFIEATTAVSGTYNAAYITNMLIYDFVFFGFSSMFSTYVSWLYFKKKAKFPQFYIWFILMGVIVTTVDTTIAGSAYSREWYLLYEIPMNEQIATLVRVVIGGLIFYSYTITSNRVAKTFTRS